MDKATTPPRATAYHCVISIGKGWGFVESASNRASHRNFMFDSHRSVFRLAFANISCASVGQEGDGKGNPCQERNAFLEATFCWFKAAFLRLEYEDHSYASQYADMPEKSIKSRNKQLKRRLDGLKSKCYTYGKMDDIDLALIIYNRAKRYYYTYTSTNAVSLWPTMGQIVSQLPSSRRLHF